MSQGKCNNHGMVEAVWKEVVSKKDGKTYKFWSCPKQEKDQFGNWVKCRVEMPSGPQEHFNQVLDKSAAQMENFAKDENITRIAIAKSMIERGTILNKDNVIDVLSEAERWFNYCMGKSSSMIAAMVNAEKPSAPASEEIALEDIPF